MGPSISIKRMNDMVESVLSPFSQFFRVTKAATQRKVKFYRRVSSAPDYDLSTKDVLFLVIDCLRADHLSPQYIRETTPFLDELDGLTTTSVSTAPWTFSSVPSILSGLYPHNHGAAYEDILRNQDEGNPPNSIRQDVYILPELLAGSGYDTHLITSITTAEIPLRGRFHSQSVHHNAPARTLVDELLTWWKSHEQSPRFGYVQFGDLHEPLQQPNSQPFGEIANIDGITRWRFGKTTEPTEEFERYRRERIRLYDTILRRVDQELKRLFEQLEARNELDDTIIVITGDHGEEFWEREVFERENFHDPRDIYGIGHGHALIPEVLNVPLIIPDMDCKTPELVSGVDITPTVLSELGLPETELENLDGVPLNNASSNRTLLAEEIAYGFDQQTVITEEYQLIHSPHENKDVLIDLSQDMVIDDDDIIESLLKHTATNRQFGETLSIDAGTEKQLSDLGYK